MATLTEEELNRYHRQIIIPQIGEAGQEKLKNSAVVVIGAGGLGSPVLMYLAAAGVGKIGIIDSDFVTESNLQRQIIYNSHDIGRLKSEVAAERISLINPLIKVRSFPIRLTDKNAYGLLTGYDIAVDCCDNFDTRCFLSDATRRAGMPLVYGAVYEFMGQASVFNYNGGLSYNDLFPGESLPDGGTATESPGVMGALPGIIGSVQACEVIKIITGAGEILTGKLLQIDALSLKAEIITLKMLS